MFQHAGKPAEFKIVLYSPLPRGRSAGSIPRRRIHEAGIGLTETIRGLFT